jgi:Ca2+-binding RTX toxin-like protein
VAFEEATTALNAQGTTAGGLSYGRINGNNYTISDGGLIVAYYENSNMSMSEFYDLLSPSFLNEAPTVANPIGDVTFDYGNAFFYQFDANVFVDMDLDDTLTYTATSINVGDPADTPTVVAAENFDGATRTFSGDSDSNSGTYAVTVTATDIAGASVSDTFNITITPPPAVLGKVTLDGPLQDALVFADYNGNGTLDTSETSTRTDSNGNYTINPTQVYSSIIAITDDTTVNIATGSAVGAGKFLMYGQAGNDVLTGTAGDNIIDGGAGADTITTGNGADHVVLRSGDGGSTLAAADTLTDFSNGTDKFLLAGSLSFSDLTITSDASNTASTVISITDTSEYLITITDVAHGYITSNDFVTVPEIA